MDGSNDCLPSFRFMRSTPQARPIQAGRFKRPFFNALRLVVIIRHLLRKETNADADSKAQSTIGVVLFTISLGVKGICIVDAFSLC